MAISAEHSIQAAGRQFHRLTAVSSDGATIVAFQVGVEKQRTAASFLAVVSELGSAPIVIAESEIVAPPSTWELRGEGLWADHICETAFEHWSYGLEAFALQLDDPLELLRRGYGDRVPLGWELEFESCDPAPTVEAMESPFEYSQSGICHGVLLFKNREVGFEGQALRQHWSGKAAPANAELAVPGLDRSDTARIALPAGEAIWWFAYGQTSVEWQHQSSSSSI